MATSYANTGGSGDRTAIITVSQSASAAMTIASGTIAQLVNGNLTETKQYWVAAAVLDKWVQFDFGVGNSYVIDEAKYYQSNTTSHGSWKWQGSANGSDWTDVGSSFTLGGAATQTQTSLNGNTTDYRYWRLLGVSGSATDSPWVYEFEFQIGTAGSAAVAANSLTRLQSVNRANTY